ncbi:MFS transporter [Endozoicomonas sp. SM1973]|uniref:MFS transporter n=1 Tax=Spartinivicinus marinus TaxID=2994442 RepID=A0A853I601_9GAMM|nr:MFS transporter [Spartinivicinus marinus]MCX4025400.1 MFS transporter [Spartinivicinus marinus]NYZ65371.1 MFS transporter [Spartinivicinus marinus]
MSTAVQSDKLYSPPIYLLMLLMSFASLVAVVITPALPEISETFLIKPTQSTWLVTAFLLGYAIGQLPYGILANRYGRKMAALAGLVVALVGSLIQLIAIVESSFIWLVIARTIIAFGGACGPVVALTVLSDCYDEQNARKKLSTLFLIFALMPCVAITIGGFLTQHYGWQSTMQIASVYIVFILIATYSQLNETLPESQYKPIQLSSNLKGIVNAFKSPNYLVFTLLATAGTATAYIFNSLSPFLSITVIKMSPQHFGLLSIITSVGLLIGSYLSGKASLKYCGRKILMFGVMILLCSSIILFILFKATIINTFSLFVPAFFLFIGVALILPNATTLAMTCVEDKANGAGLMNTNNLLLTGIGVSLSSHFAKSSQLTLPIAVLTISVVCVAMLVLITKSK